MLVRSRMTRDVVTVAPATPVSRALDLIRTHNIRHLPVVDGSRLVGIVTDRDLRLALDPDVGDAVRVEDVMSGSPVTVAPDTPVESAAALLADYRIGCLPVVEDGQIVGILTESNLLRAFVDLLVGREPHSRVELLTPDRPGELARVLHVIAVDHGINVTGVVVPPTHGDRSLVILHLAAGDVEELLRHLRRLGYEAGSPALPVRPG